MGICLQVVLVANSLPALNDVTAVELPDIVAEAAKVCSHWTSLLDLCDAWITRIKFKYIFVSVNGLLKNPNIVHYILPVHRLIFL